MIRRAVLLASVMLCGASSAHAAAPVVHVSADPQSPRFGDRFAYVVDVVVAPGEAPSVRVDDAVGAFTRIGPRTEERTASGGRVRIVVTEHLSCLTRACVPGRLGRTIALPAPRVIVGGARVVAASTAIRVRPRVGAAALRNESPRFRRERELPPVSTPVRPAVLEVGLLAGGAGLILMGLFALIFPRLRRGQVNVATRTDPLARALLLLRESATRGYGDRRRAANLTSRLVAEDDGALATVAARVAWSRAAPEPTDATTLANRVERATGNGG